MSERDAEQRDEWNAEIQREKKAARYPKWPNEVMLKIVFGGSDYVEQSCRPEPHWRVLDVGCGFGNNLVPFADLGCECHGVDIHPEMAATAQAVMEERGYNVRIQEGANRALPFPDAHFDLLLSVNTLHYEGSEANVLAALREFRRVLKPGGALYLSTVGPEHEIYRRAQLLGGHRYQVQDFDFRNGQAFFFCDTERYLLHFCETSFSHVETGRVTERLMKLPLDFLVALCR